MTSFESADAGCDGTDDDTSADQAFGRLVSAELRAMKNRQLKRQLKAKIAELRNAAIFTYNWPKAVTARASSELKLSSSELLVIC